MIHKLKPTYYPAPNPHFNISPLDLRILVTRRDRPQKSSPRKEESYLDYMLERSQSRMFFPLPRGPQVGDCPGMVSNAEETNPKGSIQEEGPALPLSSSAVCLSQQISTASHQSHKTSCTLTIHTWILPLSLGANMD